IANAGTITVPAGKVGLGSGQAITLDLNGDNFMAVTVPASVAGNGTLIDLAGSIKAAGGKVIVSAATAKALVRNVVNLSGTINVD
ncbi:hypothetical protein ACE4Z6_27670, partial [Salmonella enterica]|uniref:hypothetical protein n=1 Tax=Salmonella enterica TaxID=28901 RepID=UPI003D2E700B